MDTHLCRDSFLRAGLYPPQDPEELREQISAFQMHAENVLTKLPNDIKQAMSKLKQALFDNVASLKTILDKSRAEISSLRI